jgi:hypothetical protein
MELESAGRIDGSGPEVFCSVVDAGEGARANALGIIAGCGAEAEHYFQLQTELAKLGVSSVSVAPVYEIAWHQNRLQAEAAEQAFGYAANELEVIITGAYGHSWGGSKLASLLHHGLPGVEVAIFHNTAGFESAFANVFAHPFRTALHYASEIEHAQRHSAMKPFPIVPHLGRIGRMGVVAQHSVVASQHHKLEKHLTELPSEDVTLIGLWPERDPLFRLKSHKIFDINRVMKGSVHTEPQSNPAGVAEVLVDLIAEGRAFRNPVDTTNGQFAVAGQ